jgi:hypothetical protein
MGHLRFPALNRRQARICPRAYPLNSLRKWQPISSKLAKSRSLLAKVLRYDAGGMWATWLAVADLNGDGKPDVVVTVASPKAIDTGGATVMLGNGDGTFQPIMVFIAKAASLGRYWFSHHGDTEKDEDRRRSGLRSSIKRGTFD